MSDARGLRAVPSALTAIGALLAATGTTVTWLSVGLQQDLRGLLDLEFRGLDLIEGIASLVVAGAALVLLADARRRHGPAAVRGAIGLLVAGGLLVALPAWVAVRAQERAVDEVAEVVASSAGVTMEEAVARVRTDPDLTVRTDTSGVWLSIAGGGLVAVGGAVALGRARRRMPEPV